MSGAGGSTTGWGHNSGVPEDIELAWTPTIAAVEAAQRARRRATRVTWLEWAFCGAAIVFVAPGVPTADPYALFVVVLCVLLATGLWGFGYRWAVHYRFNPQLYTEARITLTDDGIVETQAGTTVHVPWERWSSLLHMRDAVILMMADKGNGLFLLLHRRAVPDDATWADVLDRVEGRVRPHPHDPGRRKSEAVARVLGE